jgi:predicted phosphodiesterase
MSRYGVISDVHGNLQALAAALAALGDHRVDRVIALGDLVGYNAESNQCVELLRAAGVESIAGNHDLIALGRLDSDRCALRPAFTLRRTRKELTRATRLFLAALPAVRTYEDRIALMHGTLDDPREYMNTPALVAANAARLQERLPGVRVCFFGHTHVPALLASDGRSVQARPAQGRVAVPADDGGVVFVNPGSVDAARRRDKRAELCIYDSDRGELTFLRVPYDHAKAEASAAAHGYRMSMADEALWKAARFMRRLPRRARRLLEQRLTSLRPRLG